MKIFKNKKGVDYAAMFALIVMAVSVFMMISVLFEKGADYSEPIGEIQAGVIRAAHEADRQNLYIEQAAEYAAQKAVYDLAAKGGYHDSQNKYMGFAVLNPDLDAETEYKKGLGEEVDEYLVGSDVLLSYFKRENYDYTISTENKKVKIIAKAKEDMEFDITTGQRGVAVHEIEEPEEMEGFERFDGGCSSGCWLKKDAYEKLLKAYDIAKKKGKTLYVFSAYRSEEHQAELWEQYNHNRARVCGPDDDGSFEHCPHVTGRAVDIRFSDERVKSKGDMTIDDQKELAEIMFEAGWVNYKEEWWHFEYNTKRWEDCRSLNTNIC